MDCGACDDYAGRDPSFVTLSCPKIVPDCETRTILAFMRYAILSTLIVMLVGTSLAGDWLTMPSTYTHDAGGQRTTQYQAIAAPSAPMVTNFRTSGYTHTRSSLAFGQSADNYHRVEQWGDPVRPYGEWRFPYRPFSTPYPNWAHPMRDSIWDLAVTAPSSIRIPAKVQTGPIPETECRREILAHREVLVHRVRAFPMVSMVGQAIQTSSNLIRPAPAHPIPSLPTTTAIIRTIANSIATRLTSRLS